MSFRRRGLLYSLAIGFNRFVPVWLFRVGYWHVYKLDAEKLAQIPESNSAETSVTLPADEPELRQLTGAQQWADSTGYSIRLQPEQKIVGGAWISQNEFAEPDLGLIVDLNSDQCWLSSAYVRKDHRGNGLYQACLKRIACDLGEDKNLLCAVNPVNRISSSIHQSLSVQRIGSLIAVRVLGIVIATASGKLCLDRRFSRKSRTCPLRLSIDV